MRPGFAHTLFFCLILLFAFGINFYVLGRLFSLFGIKRLLPAAIAAGVMVFLFIMALALQLSSGGLLSRMVYAAAVNWMGIAWLFFAALLLYEILRLFVPINPRLAGWFLVIVVGMATAAAMLNTQWVRVKKLPIPGPVDLRIVQLADIHVGSVRGAFLQKIVTQVNALHPDMVVITGDLLDHINARTRTELAVLQQLRAPVYFIMGNHEHYAQRDRVAAALTLLGVTVLRNQMIETQGITIIGLDDNRDSAALEEELTKLKPPFADFILLLTHRPIAVETLSRLGIHLTLAGHTHAGQLFPFNFIVAAAHRYFNGLYEDNGCYLYVTNGTGTWGPRMRLGTRSEITLVEISRTNAAGAVNP